MDMIVGGSSYMSQLAGCINTSDKGQYFSFSFSGASSSGSMCTAATDKGMQLLIKKADQYGSIILHGPNGKNVKITANQLRAML